MGLGPAAYDRICSLLTCSPRICSHRDHGGHQTPSVDDVGSVHRTSRRYPRGGCVGVPHDGGFVEVGEVTNRSRKSTTALCGGGGVETLEVLLQSFSCDFMAKM
jgi:hypothetical protein